MSRETISVSLSSEELELIDRLRKESGETRSAFLVRKAGGQDLPVSRRQLLNIAKRAREAIIRGGS